MTRLNPERREVKVLGSNGTIFVKLNPRNHQGDQSIRWSGSSCSSTHRFHDGYAESQGAPHDELMKARMQLDWELVAA